MATFKELREFTRRGAEHYGIDPSLAFAMFEEESKWNPEAVSPKGALGIAQLMPETAKDLGVNPADPWENIDGGLRYLKQQLDKFGKPDLAIAAYNAGPGAVEKAGGIPANPETPGHVLKVMQRYGEIRQQRLARTGKMGDTETPIEATKPEDIAGGPTERFATGLTTFASDMLKAPATVAGEMTRAAHIPRTVEEAKLPYAAWMQTPYEPEQQPLSQLGEALSQQAKTFFGTTKPAETFAERVEEGLGTAAGFMLGMKIPPTLYGAVSPLMAPLEGMVGTAALKTPGPTATQVLGLATAAPLTQASQYAQKLAAGVASYVRPALLGSIFSQVGGYERAKEQLGTQDALDASRWNGLAGLIMGAPFGRIMSRINLGTGGLIGNMVKGGIEMSSSMALMRTLDNAFDHMNYDDKRHLLDGVIEAIPVDATIGAILPAFHRTLKARIDAGKEPELERYVEERKYDERSKSWWIKYEHGWYEAEPGEGPPLPPTATEPKAAPAVEPKKELSETELEKKVRTVEKKHYGEKQANRVQQHYRDTYGLDFEIVDSEVEGKFQLKRKAAEAPAEGTGLSSLGGAAQAINENLVISLFTRMQQGKRPAVSAPFENAFADAYKAGKIPSLEAAKAFQRQFVNDHPELYGKQSDLQAEFEQNERDSEVEIPAGVVAAEDLPLGVVRTKEPLTPVQRQALTEAHRRFMEEQRAKDEAKTREEAPSATSVNRVDIGKGLRTTAEEREIDDAAVDAFEATKEKKEDKGSYVQAAKKVGLSIAETKARIKWATGQSDKRPYEVSDEAPEAKMPVAREPQERPPLEAPLTDLSDLVQRGREAPKGSGRVQAPPEFGSKREASIWLEDNKMIGTIVPKGKGFKILDLRPEGSAKFYSLSPFMPNSPWFSKLQEEIVKDHANWPYRIDGATALDKLKRLVTLRRGKKEELDDMLRLTGLKQRLEAMKGAKKDDVLNEIMSNGIEVEERVGADNSITLALMNQGTPVDTLPAIWHIDSTGTRSLSLPLVEDPILQRRLTRYGAEHNADVIRQVNAQGEEIITSLTPEAKEFWRKNPMAMYSLSPFMMTPENARGLREVMEDQAVRGGVPRDIARGYHSDDMGPVEKVCALTQWLVDKNPRLYPIFDATHRAMERASTGLQKAIEPWAATWLGFKQEQKRTVTDTLVELDRAADELRKEGKSPYAERGITEPRWIKVGRSGIKINPAHWEQWREKTAEKLGLPEEEMEMVFQQRKMYDTILEAKWNLTRKFYRRGSKGIQDLRHEVFELEDYFPHTRTGEFAVAGYVKLPDGTTKKVYDYAFDPPAQLYELQRFGNKFEVRRIGDRASYGTYKTREKAQAAQKKLGAEYEVADIGLRGVEGYVERVLRPIINKDPILADLGIEPGNWRIERRESSYVQGLQNQPLLAMALQKTTDGAIRAIRKNTSLTAEQKETQIKAYEQLWNAAVAQTLKKATMGGHWAKRSGVYGYDTGDAGKIAHAYAEQFYHTLSKMEMVGELTRLTGAIKGDRPREAKYAANYMQRVLNPQQDLSKLMYGLRGFAYWMHINPIKFFGGNITNGLVGGATQLVTDAGNKAWGFVPKAMHDAARWYAKREGLTADESQFLAGLFDSGVARPQYLDAMGMRLRQDPSASMAAYRWQQAKNFVSWPARTSEIYSRLYTALAAYRVAKAGLVNSDRAVERFGAGIREKIEGKPTEKQYERLVKYASKVVDDSHMIWGELNRPELVTQTGAVGRLGGTALIFRHYAQGLAHMWKSMWKEGRPGDRRGQMAMAESMAIQMLLGGMIGGTIISSAYEKFMGTSMWDDLRKKFGTKPADALKYGPLALTGFNYHSSFDMEPPSTWEELFGVPASMVRNYQKAWQAAGVGDYKRAFEYAVPLKIARDISVGIRQRTAGLTTAGGRAIPGPGTGREPYKTSTFDMVKQFGGFTPLDVTRLQDTRREVQSIEARRQAKQDELVTRYVNARRAGDWAELDAIWAEAAEWNDKWREKGVPQLTVQLRAAINARMRPEKPSKRMRGLAREMMLRAMEAEREAAMD